MIKKEDLRIGQKVRCYKKSTYSASWKEVQEKYGTNPVGDISSIYDTEEMVEIRFNNDSKYFFKFDDIGLTIFDEKPAKYKILRPLTIQNIASNHPCWNEFQNLLGEYPGVWEYSIEQVSTKKIWIDWLIQNSFIREVKEETFKIGDHFQIMSEDFSEVYMLSHIGNNNVILISKKGTYWRMSIKVKNINAIPKSELDNYIGIGHSWAKVSSF